MSSKMVMVKHVPCPNCGVYMRYGATMITRRDIIVMFICDNCPDIKLLVNLKRDSST